MSEELLDREDEKSSEFAVADSFEELYEILKSKDYGNEYIEKIDKFRSLSSRRIEEGEKLRIDSHVPGAWQKPGLTEKIEELFELEALEKLVRESLEGDAELEAMMGARPLSDKKDELLEKAKKAGFTDEQFEKIFEKIDAEK